MEKIKKGIDTKIIMGMGIGIVITCLLLLPFYQIKDTSGKIETKAREMGMIYPDEMKALTENEEGK